MPVFTSWVADQRPDGVGISFNPVDRRAHARIPLEPVPLAVVPGTAGPLTVHWTAAGIDAAGQDSGTIALTIELSTLPNLPAPPAAPDDLADDATAADPA